jgi:hypothetical protein
LSCEDLAAARLAYVPQMLASGGVDNTAIEAADAAAPREAVLGPRVDDRLALRRCRAPSDPC